jgi:hypothetical protein
VLVANFQLTNTLSKFPKQNSYQKVICIRVVLHNCLISYFDETPNSFLESCYSTQTSIRPSLSLEQLAQEDCGYLLPNQGPGPSLSNDGYLMPDKQTSIAVDNEGYLLASPSITTTNGCTDEKSFEHWPMLHAKDNGNVIPV